MKSLNKQDSIGQLPLGVVRKQGGLEMWDASFGNSSYFLKLLVVFTVLSDLFPYLLSTSQSPITVAVLCIFFKSVECWELNLTCVLLLFRTHKQIVHCPCSTCVHVLSACGGSSWFCNIMLCNVISWGSENGCAEQLPRPHQCDGCWALLHGCCALLPGTLPRLLLIICFFDLPLVAFV